MTVTAVDWQGNTTTQTVTYKVVTPGPVANDDTAHTINPNEVTIPVLNNDTSIFPLDPTTVHDRFASHLRDAMPQLSGVVRYTPTSASTTCGHERVLHLHGDGHGRSGVEPGHSRR